MKRTQVAVVGAGPAGLSAAIAAARAGAQVVVFDENQIAGGQLRYRILDGDTVIAPIRMELVDQALANGVELALGAKVWGLFADQQLGVVRSEQTELWHADQIILATGSTDRTFPFTGGSLPGVMTARGVQLVLNCWRVLPGKRFAVLGTGPAAEEVVRDITLAGGQVVLEVDHERPRHSMMAEGDEGVRSLTIDGEQHGVDIIVVAVGRQPDAELSLMSDCAHGYLPDLGGIVPIRDDRCQTTVPGLLVAGDAAGVCDLAAALADGTAAGTSAAYALGLIDEESLHQTLMDGNDILRDRVRRISTLRPMAIRA